MKKSYLMFVVVVGIVSTVMLSTTSVYGQDFLSERYEEIGQVIEICKKLEELDQFTKENIHEVTFEEIELCEKALGKDLDGIYN